MALPSRVGVLPRRARAADEQVALTSEISQLIEAMAVGLPVVCSDIPNHREIIDNSRTGFIFSTTDQLVNTIRNLKKDAKLRRLIGSEARKYVIKNHNIADTAQEYIRLYKKHLVK